MNSNANKGNIFRSKRDIYAWDAEGWSLGVLDNNYLMAFDPKIKNVLRSCLDLTTITKYSVDKNAYGRFELKMFPHEMNGGRRNYEIEKSDELFKCKIIDILVDNKATIIENSKNENNSDVKKDLEEEKENKNIEVVFFSQLFLVHMKDNKDRNTPYFCVLRNKKIEMYEDYKNYISGHPIKSLDILSLFSAVRPIMYQEKYGLALIPKADGDESSSNASVFLSDCQQKHGLQKIENPERDYDCNECLSMSNIYMTGCSMCHYYICSNCVMTSGEIFLLTLSNNDRHEWLSHLQFLFFSGIMPNVSATLDKNTIKTIMNENNNEMEEDTEEIAEDDDMKLAVDGDEDGEEEESANMVSNLLLGFLEMRREEVLSATAKNSILTDIQKLMIVDQVCQRWRKNNRVSNNISLKMLWDALDISFSFVSGCYSRALSEIKHKKQPVCSLGLNCSLFKHYMRDRSGKNNRTSTNVNTNTNKNNISMRNVLLESMNGNIVDIADKVHAFLYNHVSEDEQTEEEVKEDGDSLYMSTKRNKKKDMQMNVEKFIIDGKGKFGFGEDCGYWYYYKDIGNFIVPASICLYSEVCSNLEISSEFCLKPINFWCLYMQATQLRTAFGKNFKACDGLSLNFNWNVAIGCLMSVNHYLCLLLYSDWTAFQREFKKYTRRITADETDAQFYIRNSYVPYEAKSG